MNKNYFLERLKKTVDVLNQNRCLDQFICWDNIVGLETMLGIEGATAAIKNEAILGTISNYKQKVSRLKTMLPEATYDLEGTRIVFSKFEWLQYTPILEDILQAPNDCSLLTLRYRHLKAKLAIENSYDLLLKEHAAKDPTVMLDVEKSLRNNQLSERLQNYLTFVGYMENFKILSSKVTYFQDIFNDQYTYFDCCSILYLGSVISNIVLDVNLRNISKVCLVLSDGIVVSIQHQYLSAVQCILMDHANNVSYSHVIQPELSWHSKPGVFYALNK